MGGPRDREGSGLMGVSVFVSLVGGCLAEGEQEASGVRE